MADPRFFANAGPFSAGRIAELTKAELRLPAGRDDGDGPELVDVMPLADAGAGHLSFIDNRKYIADFVATSAAAVIVHPELVDRAPDGVALLVTSEPYRAYALAAAAFYPPPAVEPGVSPAAVVAPDAEIAASCRIEAGAVVGSGVRVGENTLIAPNAVLDAGVVVGRDCIVGAGASLKFCLVEDRVILHPGVAVGQDGFGFAPGPAGHLKVPQLGRVLIESDVEIGANTTIDRGTGPDTVIGAGTKIDNLVQIAHNVRVGKGCIIVSQVGISGSTEVGDFVMIGGQAGLTGHLQIGSGAKVAAQSGVMRDIPPGLTVGGSPAKDMREWLRETATLSRLTKRRDP